MNDGPHTGNLRRLESDVQPGSLVLLGTPMPSWADDALHKPLLGIRLTAVGREAVWWETALELLQQARWASHSVRS